jgi:8-oxo-dGTP pyrophosphatase MutT (NUDIX family)
MPDLERLPTDIITVNMPQRKPVRNALRVHEGSFHIREDGAARLEVHVAGVCVRNTEGRWQVLVARRTAARQLFPKHWECGGGTVHRGEGFHAAIRRQIFEEFGLTVEPVSILEVYEIHTTGQQRIIPGIRFFCEVREGTVLLNEREFTQHRWLDLPVQERLPWIGGLKEVLDNVAASLYANPDPARTPRKQPVGFWQEPTTPGNKRQSH